MKRQTCRPSDPDRAARFRAKALFEQMMKEGFDILQVTDAFSIVADKYGVTHHDDVLGCHDCSWAGGEVVYCRCSIHNPSHPSHVCAPGSYDCCTSPALS